MSASSEEHRDRTGAGLADGGADEAGADVSASSEEYRDRTGAGPAGGGADEAGADVSASSEEYRDRTGAGPAGGEGEGGGPNAGREDDGGADGSVRRPRRRRAAAWLSLLVLAGTAAAIGWLLLGGAPRASDGRIAVGEPAPAIEAALPGTGTRLRLADFRGEPVLVHFWATWCEPCKRELPRIDLAAAKLAERPQGSGAVLVVNVGDSRATMTEFAEASGIALPLASDAAGEAAGAFRVRALPASFVIGPDGRIERIVQGEFASADEVLDALDAAR
ncbi:TlpA family protein disulfide reductase [Paenibacillus sp. B01]|uniref:TlpA family protein disulfide reductase n=1 Tax=Paenibacillus sp. B01 TaxID=2660554 RepID=UPI001890EB89|nr:TlpA disulfide reductase family protein [Paenibacillus sp. B01]